MSSFWALFSLRALLPFLGAVFCTFLAFGFLRDIQEVGRFTPAYLAFVAVETASMAVAYALAMARGPRRWLPVVLVLQLGAEYLGYRWLGARAAPLSEPALEARLRFDATMSILTLFAGYLAFVGFIARQGIARLRIDTEIALARDTHAALVPRISYRSESLEVLGASFAAHEVGGDLVDVVATGPCTTCYVVDVSGHGVPAGTLMAALKSGARMRLLQPASSSELLRDLNRVLFGLKRPNMFATAACVQAEGARLEYCLAGHLPILHWRSRTHEVVRLGHGHIALGILEDEGFTHRAIDAAPGDVLAIVTDGLTEVEDRRARELGLEGVAAVLASNGDAPLDRLFDTVVNRARAHGPQRDDQTLMLVRILRTG